MNIVCCKCKEVIGQKDGCGQIGDTHTFCKTCLIEYKKDIWEAQYFNAAEGRYFHPWVTDSREFIIFESTPYRGGLLVIKYGENYNSIEEIEAVCKSLNRLA